MPPPPAATISVRDTLAMLDGDKLEIAAGVANDQYVFWLGSGISRERMPDLKELAKRVLVRLHELSDPANVGCRFQRALERVVQLAAPSEREWDDINYGRTPTEWPVFEALASRLVTNYARMLNVTVDGEDADYLLWTVLDAANVYSNAAIQPDAEHLCLAALGMEGVASEMPSANWDGLIESAFGLLGGTQPVLRVAVSPLQTRSNRRRGNLYKFHGCARSARDEPNIFRNLLVARQNQINGWVANNPLMAGFLTNLIATKSTLMLGLSAQDANIQALFANAQNQMAWPWPSHPPAYAFAENALGGDQEGLLQNVYHAHHSAVTKPLMDENALVQAYAKPLLLALYLHVVTAKLQLLVGYATVGLAPADRDNFADGLLHARNCVADVVQPSAGVVAELLALIGRTLSVFRDGTLLSAASGIYSPVSVEPLDRMPADPNISGSGICQFAVALGLIGLGLHRSYWQAEKADAAAPDDGALTLIGRSGPAKIYFVSTPQAAIRLGLNGLVAANDDAVIVHSQAITAPMARAPRRAPGRTGLAMVREISMSELVQEGSETEDLIARFRSGAAL